MSGCFALIVKYAVDTTMARVKLSGGPVQKINQEVASSVPQTTNYATTI